MGKIRPSLLFLQDNLAAWIKTIISLIIFFSLLQLVFWRCRTQYPEFSKVRFWTQFYTWICVGYVLRIRFVCDTLNGLTSNRRALISQAKTHIFNTVFKLPNFWGKLSFHFYFGYPFNISVNILKSKWWNTLQSLVLVINNLHFRAVWYKHWNSCTGPYGLSIELVFHGVLKCTYQSVLHLYANQCVCRVI